jgi:hypothetical protein
MFLGHGLAAFAIAASVAARRGWRGERALAVGLVAGLFATLPDVDMLYAVAGLLGGMEGVFVTSDAMKADIEYSSDAVEWLEKADPDAREGWIL